MKTTEKCWFCNGTGKHNEPLNKEEYERVFDRYDGQGIFDMSTCRSKALAEVGYTVVPCPMCSSGRNEANSTLPGRE